MSGTRLFLAVALLAVSVGVGNAGDGEPFLYFATQDPFVSPEAPAAKNDVHMFGGVFAERSFGSVMRFWDAEYTSNYMIGGVYGRDFHELGAGFVLGGVAGAALRFGENDDTSGEIWAGVRIRHHGLVIGDLAIAPGLTLGFSAVTSPTEIEREREIRYGGDATLLGFAGPEMAFRLRQAPNVELVYQLHHRSGSNGLFGDLGEGSNANTIGLRYRF
ncbi:hypothetical protein [Chelativorans salis]|uniref:Outer membrane protein beta-barrel domain-containing protein n=1 Tax=Chelativorans salis TaxID=2978478 RepID=A0ABT2LK72_9HYPH|nr:hypothetical protein [Chelativorans sp. EGI FJ00035]MCT7373803.1 hypothetical protein [Chelativorans sp. EGI FJ00035]